MYLMWFDDSKRPLDDKIAGALAAYDARYGTRPGIVLVHPEQVIQRADVLVVTGESQGIPVQKNNFWMGRS